VKQINFARKIFSKLREKNVFLFIEIGFWKVGTS